MFNQLLWGCALWAQMHGVTNDWSNPRTCGFLLLDVSPYVAAWSLPFPQPTVEWITAHTNESAALWRESVSNEAAQTDSTQTFQQPIEAPAVIVPKISGSATNGWYELYPLGSNSLVFGIYNHGSPKRSKVEKDADKAAITTKVQACKDAKTDKDFIAALRALLGM